MRLTLSEDRTRLRLPMRWECQIFFVLDSLVVVHCNLNRLFVCMPQTSRPCIVFCPSGLSLRPLACPKRSRCNDSARFYKPIPSFRLHFVMHSELRKRLCKPLHIEPGRIHNVPSLDSFLDCVTSGNLGFAPPLPKLFVRLLFDVAHLLFVLPALIGLRADNLPTVRLVGNGNRLAIFQSNLFRAQDARLPRLVAKWRTPAKLPKRRVRMPAKLLRLVKQVARLAIGFTRL